MTTSSSIENIETARLLGRRIQPEDYPRIRRMHQDRQLMATLGGLRTSEESRAMLTSHLECWQRDGYGPWIWHAGSDGRFVGCGGLRKTAIEGRDEVEVFYALVPEFWGQGLATETASASVHVAFDHLGTIALVAFTLPTNLASRRVMEKCGFTFECDIVWKDLPHVLYRMKRPTYDGLRSNPDSLDA
jgi:ribosomal-protein-alanine N-acetyltransferase